MAGQVSRPPALVWISCGFSLLVVFGFIFVRAPHPWGWEGFDHYRDLGLAVAHGRPYPTVERMWGYPYFLAICYWIFGERQWVPLVIQALLNALIPLLVYLDAKRRVDERTAVLAAALAGVLSFNNIYASTQASDALCTVLFVATVVSFGMAERSGGVGVFALSGLLAGLALLFRPNMLLLPAALLATDLALAKRLRPAQWLAFATAALVCWTPWVARNYRVADRFIPATTHGGIQFWIGTLQAGRYFENWFDNPRAVFEATPFDVSLPSREPLRVTAGPNPVADAKPLSISLVYWTDREPQRVRVTHEGSPAIEEAFLVPTQPAPAIIYYYFESQWATPEGPPVAQDTPTAGSLTPAMRFVTTDQLGDLDVHGDLLDIYDIVRLIRFQAWHEPAAHLQRLDLDGDGRLTAADLDLAASELVSAAGAPRRGQPRGAVKTLRIGDDSATLVLKDDSTLTVPKTFHGRVTELVLDGKLAGELYRSRRAFASLNPSTDVVQKLQRYELRHELSFSFDEPFYRAEPRSQDRYLALGWVNLRETPFAFVAASLRRILRLFVVYGSTEPFRARQFRFSELVYAAATIASVAYLVLFAIGAVVAVWRGWDVALPLVAVLFVPATIFPLFGDMRFTVTAQPFVFLFIAVSLRALAERLARGATTP